jgi:hypothetical protein
MFLFRFSGWFLFRFEERKFLDSFMKAPPRNTRGAPRDAGMRWVLRVIRKNVLAADRFRSTTADIDSKLLVQSLNHTSVSTVWLS